MSDPVEKHQKRLREWASSARHVKPMLAALDGDRDVSNALYAFSERGLFEGMSIEPDLAILIWSVVETARQEGFPADLAM